MTRQQFHELGIDVNPSGRVEQRVKCPHCSRRGSDKNLGANIQTGRYHCFRCSWAGRAGGHSTGSAPRVLRNDDPAIAELKRERLKSTWQAAVSLSHANAYAVRAYLESRGLNEVLHDPPSVLRAHPGLQYWDGHGILGSYPAMVALFHDRCGEPATLHVTYLRTDGSAKAGVPSPKKIMGVPVRGATRGGAIHLYEPHDGRLGIAEGIESALSLHLLQGVPVWSAYCAGNLEQVELPTNLRELYIGLDLDESGQGERSARVLANRIRNKSGTRVCYVKPDIAGYGDLNDELQRRVC